MLTTDQMATILRRAGVVVPPFPAPRLPVRERCQQDASQGSREDWVADDEQQAAAAVWIQAIQTLYVEFSVARTARSLREAEQARSDAALRRTPSDAWERD